MWTRPSLIRTHLAYEHAWLLPYRNHGTCAICVLSESLQASRRFHPRLLQRLLKPILKTGPLRKPESQNQKYGHAHMYQTLLISTDPLRELSILWELQNLFQKLHAVALNTRHLIVVRYYQPCCKSAVTWFNVCNERSLDIKFIDSRWFAVQFGVTRNWICRRLKCAPTEYWTTAVIDQRTGFTGTATFGLQDNAADLIVRKSPSDIIIFSMSTFESDFLAIYL